MGHCFGFYLLLATFIVTSNWIGFEKGVEHLAYLQGEINVQDKISSFKYFTVDSIENKSQDIGEDIPVFVVAMKSKFPQAQAFLETNKLSSNSQILEGIDIKDLSWEGMRNQGRISWNYKISGTKPHRPIYEIATTLAHVKALHAFIATNASYGVIMEGKSKD